MTKAASKSLLTAKSKKPKTVRKTKSENYLVNWKYLGEEPSYKGKIDKVQLIRAFNWYNVMTEEEDVRQYINDYLKHVKHEILIKRINTIPFMHLPLSSAWIFRLFMRGVEIEEQMLSDAMLKLLNALEHEKEIREEKKEILKPNIQERVRERGYDIIGDVEELLDKGEKFSMYEWLQKNEIPAMYASKIVEFYEPLLEEYNNALIDNEGYKHFSKKQLNEKISFLNSLIDDCKRFAGNVKKARAPRKKKAPTTEKLLKNFTYLKAFNEYKLQSIDPATIIGAQELWTFDTKSNKLTVFRARGPVGLTINRTAIGGYDSVSSLTKKIGRKTEETLKKVLTGGKIVLRKLMDEINVQPTNFTDRINNNTVLVKVTR
jgi:hypothetical protein